VKRFCAGLLCAALLGLAQAEDAATTDAPSAATPPALEVNPRRLGYAVDQPEILIRQRLFGLAHGMSLLAAACLDMPAHSKPIQDAYAAWHEKQGKTIEIIVHDLADYYFGSRAAEAQWQDLSRALNLKDSIEPALGDITLHAACASLPAAIIRPRYELDRMLVEGFESEGKEAVAAAPTVTPTAAPGSAPPASDSVSTAEPPPKAPAE
jgi:hypothetical protein